MKILLDTHILLWVLSNDAKLSEKARKLVENEENEIYYSIVSLWEVELKRLAHPEAMPVCAKELAEYCEQYIYALAGLKREENALPHKDPFDRMLICQATTENMLFVTHDSLIPGYCEPCILAV